MDDRLAIARTIWEIGVLVRGDTAGGRLALTRATEIHSTLEGVGESRLTRAAVEGAQANGAHEQSDVPLSTPGVEGIAWPDRLLWIARVLRADIETAFPTTHEILRPLEFSANPPPGAEQARNELDHLWESHGIDACNAALAHSETRSRVGSVVALLALLLFLGAMTFVVRDLMKSADREREYQDQAELYSVPEEAIESAPTP